MADIIFEEILPYIEGEGDTGKTSREKINRNFDKLKRVGNFPELGDVDGCDLALSDGRGKAIAAFRNGHVKTKNFDSSEAVTRDEQKAALKSMEETIADKGTLPFIQDDESADLSFADEQGNAIAKLKDGHIKTKNFDSRDISNLVPINDDSKADLDIRDENGNVIAKFEEGHFKTKFFNSKDISNLVPINDNKRTDLDFRDENGNILVKFENGHIKTKEFDSENITASNSDTIEYPQFMGYGIDDTTGADTPSLVHLTSTWVRAAAGDIVRVKDATKIGGFKVYEYKSVKGKVLAKSDSFDTKRYIVQNNGTAYIRILGIMDGETTLLTNAAFRGNVFVTHTNPVRQSDDKLQLNSTIPDGWYVSERTEFPAALVKKGGYWNQWGMQEYDEVVPLEGENVVDGVTVTGIYDHYNDLYVKYGPEGTDIIGRGYITREQLGTDESGTFPIWRYVFEPKAVDVVGQATGDYGKSRGVENESLPTICLEACLHGSERPCSRALLNFLIHLCDNWQSDKYLEWLRWNVRLVVIPIANPWGYVNQSRKNSRKVDLNRNFNAGGAWALFPDKGQTAGDYKGTAPYSETETRLIARNMLEHADATAYYDLHTHGSYGGFEVMTRFDYGNDVFLGNILSSVGIELTKGFTVSGIVNHGMGDSTVYESNAGGVFKYFGQVGCAAGSVPYISNQGTQELGLPASSPEVTYLRQHFDKVQFYPTAAYDDTCYTLPTDCMNEEYVVNLVLCTLRQRFIQGNS